MSKVLRLYTDGGARGNPGPAGLGMVIEDDQGLRLWGGYRYVGTATNNTAEYLALIEGLRKAAEWRPDILEVHMDSELIVNQLEGRYKVKSPDLKPLHQQARRLLGGFPRFTVTHVPRERNRGADALANRAMDEGTGKSPHPDSPPTGGGDRIRSGSRRTGGRSASVRGGGEESPGSREQGAG